MVQLWPPDEHTQYLQGLMVQPMDQACVEEVDKAEVQQKSEVYESNQAVEIRCCSLLQARTWAELYTVLH